MATLIQTEKLTKSYGKSRGIREVTFSIQEGEVFGFLGPNGAGKTTTIRTLMGLLRASSGTATIGELDCWKQSTAVKKLVGYLPGEFTFDAGLRGAQVIEYLGNLRGGVDRKYVRDLVERLGFDPSKRFREYSRGNKQKLGLLTLYITLAFLAELLKALFSLPDWLMSLSVFHQYGNPMKDGMNWPSFLGMAGVALALLIVGLVQFRAADVERG